MSDYLDTSLIIAALCPETGSSKAHEYLGKAEAGTLFISDWTITEVSSALAIKVRTKELTLEDRAEILSVWTQMRHQSLNQVTVQSGHFVTAARFVDQHALGLRAGDALHLAIAQAAGFRVVTLDKMMGEAALALGIGVGHS